MIINTINDPRVAFAKKATQALISKKMSGNIYIYIHSVNIHMIVDQTTLYTVNYSDNYNGEESLRDIIFVYEESLDLGEDECVYRYDVEGYCRSIVGNYSGSLSTNPILEIPDLKTPEYEKYISIKTNDGSLNFKGLSDSFDTTIKFPFFAGIISVNKADTISLLVKPYPMIPEYQIVELHLFKKKLNRMAFIQFRILKLI